MSHVVGNWILVMGASGGVGASSLAAVLAAQSVRSGRQVCLVDGHFGRGGLEVSLGAERSPGLRWPDFARAQGAVEMATVCRSLIQWAGVSVLSSSRVSRQRAESGAIHAILDSLAQTSMTVILDAPPSWVAYLPKAGASAGGNPEFSLPRSKGILVTARNLGSIAGALGATAQLGSALECGVAVTSHQHRALTPKEVARSAGLRLWGDIRADKKFAELIELGAGPVGARSRARTDIERLGKYVTEQTL